MLISICHIGIASLKCRGRELIRSLGDVSSGRIDETGLIITRGILGRRYLRVCLCDAVYGRERISFHI